MPKEPWQMTRAEFNKVFPTPEIGARYNLVTGKEVVITDEETVGLGGLWTISDAKTGKKIGSITTQNLNKAVLGYPKAHTHKGIVRQAISEGKSIPPEVLKDYPDLAKQVEALQPKAKAAEAIPAKTTLPQVAKLDYQRIWDSAKLGRRVQIARDAGWITRQGQLTRAGERIAESKWSSLSPAAQNVIKSEIDILYKPRAISPKATEAIPAKVTGGKRIVKYERGSVGDAVRAATKLKSDVNLYVYPTAEGMAIAKEPPPFGLQHIIIRPDGTHKVVSAGASFEAGRLAGDFIPKEESLDEIGDLYWFTVNELQFLCGVCGQGTAGNKEALINRLKKVDKERLKAKIKEMKAIPPIPTLEQVQRGLRRQIRQMRGK